MKAIERLNNELVELDNLNDFLTKQLEYQLKFQTSKDNIKNIKLQMKRIKTKKDKIYEQLRLLEM